jgi:lon-related putative ATP-dependent protease
MPGWYARRTQDGLHTTLSPDCQSIRHSRRQGDKMRKDARELTLEELWHPFDPATLDFETTDTLPGEISIIGQDRAVEAIEFGISIESVGYSIFALGPSGTGRTTTIRTLLDRTAAEQPVPPDLIYVNNFSDENRPEAIALPPGTAVRFRHDMQELVGDLLREIPRAFESEEYDKQREQILREMQEQRSQTLGQLEEQVNEKGFTLFSTAQGFAIAPVLNGQVLSPEAFHHLDTATQHEIEARQEELHDELANAARALRDLEKETKHRLRAYDREIAGFAVKHLLEDLLKEYGHLEEVAQYLAGVQSDVVENLAGFRQDEEGEAEGLLAMMQVDPRGTLLRRYQVNVLVDHAKRQGAPVIFEPNPTYGNLLGRIEHRSEQGTMITDFAMIKAGALHRANGGYLVVEADALLTSPQAWDGLKRALKNRQIRTEEMGTQLQLISTVTLEPEPIPLQVKVVLIGDPMVYYLLYEHDPDFAKLFKVQADFGADFRRTPEACRCYAQFIATRCQQEKLLPFDPSAVARVIEFGSRLAEHQNKLSTRFGEIADLVREASFWARRQRREATTAADVQQAIAQRIRRANRVEEEIQESIHEGTVRVDVEGTAVGQVNGLSVLSLGNYSFGQPSRITARTYTGKEGVLSLDREAKLSGRIYDKGVLTLSGYLGGKYALDVPFSLSASISFEQSYDEIEGDSASSTELYALLSSLSELPLRQGIAVTGSVDQQGHIQPVGGINEKIEGFFDTCQRRGLDRAQGVLIPVQNVIHLMLREDVRQAVADGTFHLYPLHTVDEGIEILTGVPAGEMDEEGLYPEDSVHGRVQDRLEAIAENLRASEQQDEDDDPPEGDNPGWDGCD